MINSSKCNHFFTKLLKHSSVKPFGVSSVKSGKQYSKDAQNTTNNNALPYEKIPGPSALPVLGTMHHFALGGQYQGMDLEKLSLKLNEDYGDIVRVKGLPGKPDLVFLFDFDAMEKVYRTEGPWPARPSMETREHYLREKRPEIFKSTYGLFHSDGKEWQEIRSKVNQPMMQMKITKQYLGWIEEIANDFLTRLMLHILDENGSVSKDFLTEVNKWSLESIARIAIDTRLGCLDADLPENSDGMKVINSMNRFFQLGYELDILPSTWKYISTPKYKEVMQLLDNFTEVAIKHISEATKRLEKNPTTDDGNLSVLEKLLKIDPQVAIIMALDMFFAGVDTTASSTITTLYQLAKNPEVQNRLREELSIAFPEGSSITAEGLNNVPYLKACLKESFRVKPVAIANGRITAEDLVLGGYTIPKGTSILMFHQLTAVIKNQYPDGDKFLPERWLRTGSNGAPATKCAHKFANLPFGFGPRMCVGRRFAELEMEVLISKVIANYRIDWTGPDMEYKTTMITSPTGDMRFKFTPLR